MKDDPLNRLPVDPEWVRLADQLAAEAAQKLGGMVLMIILQPGGKMGLTYSGVPESGPLHDAAQDIPDLLLTMAHIVRFMDKRDADTPDSEKH